MKAAETALFKGIVGKELSHLLGCIGARERDFAPGEALLTLGETRPHAGVLFAGGVAGTGVTGVRSSYGRKIFSSGRGLRGSPRGRRGIARSILQTDRACAVCGAFCRCHREMAERSDRLARGWA